MGYTTYPTRKAAMDATLEHFASWDCHRASSSELWFRSVDKREIVVVLIDGASTNAIRAEGGPYYHGAPREWAEDYTPRGWCGGLWRRRMLADPEAEFDHATATGEVDDVESY
jgi:hypothetical protein